MLTFPTFIYMIYLLTAIGLTPGGSITVYIYTQTLHITTQITTNLEECGPCPVFANSTLAFALQQRKKNGKTSVRVRKTSVRLRKASVIRVIKTSVIRVRKLPVFCKTSDGRQFFPLTTVTRWSFLMEKRCVHRDSAPDC